MAEVPSDPSLEFLRLGELADLAWQRGATHLHVAPDQPAMPRVSGRALPGAGEWPVWSAEQIQACAAQLGWPEQAVFSFDHHGDWRALVRFSLAKAHGRSLAGVRSRSAVVMQIQLAPHTPPDFELLGYPSNVRQSLIGVGHTGLILVAGPSGSGLTTTMASTLVALARSRAGVGTCVSVATLESPVEYVLPWIALSGSPTVPAMIVQSEVGADGLTWSRGLQTMVKGDFDLCLVSEARPVVGGRVQELGPLLAILADQRLTLTGATATSWAEAFGQLCGPSDPDGGARTGYQLAGNLRAILLQQTIRPRGLGETKALVVAAALILNVEMRRSLQVCCETAFLSLENLQKCFRAMLGASGPVAAVLDKVPGHLRPQVALRD
jgi:hypothetical protein